MQPTTKENDARRHVHQLRRLPAPLARTRHEPHEDSSRSSSPLCLPTVRRGELHRVRPGPTQAAGGGGMATRRDPCPTCSTDNGSPATGRHHREWFQPRSIDGLFVGPCREGRRGPWTLWCSRVGTGLGSSCAERFGREPKLTGWKSASKIGSTTISAAVMITGSAMVGMPSVRISPALPGFRMLTRQRGFGP